MEFPVYGVTDDQAALDRILSVLQNATNILITTHTEPDGDAVSGSLALANILKQIGKSVIVYFKDPVPYAFLFLDGAQDVVDQLSEGSAFDATCFIDLNDIANVGNELPPRDVLGTLILIDHHPTQVPFADVAYVDPKSSSMGEIMLRISKALSVQVTPALAKQIYCAIFSDTGSFRYGKTNPDSLRTAAEMLEYGADPWEMTVHIHESHPVARQKLLGAALQSLTCSPSGRCASIVIQKTDLAQYGGDEAMIDGFINFARGIAGVEVAVQLKELDPFYYQVAFRSRGTLDVSKIAAQLGGGGKKNAAGCKLRGSPEDLRQQIFALVEAQYQQRFSAQS